MAAPNHVRRQVQSWRTQGLSIGLVPTMGALHRGHLSLLERARADNDRVIVSVFVNPLQFGAGEDFERYPRDLAGDLRQLAAAGADAAYTPTVTTMYPPGSTTRVQVGEVAEPLEGVSRPGHFEGVATVVLKLFNACLPDRAYFGQKDAQQVAVVSRMARDLDTGVEIVACPTIREPDGLALSSRNAYLSVAERQAAAVLSQALRAADAAWAGGERDPARLKAILHATLDAEPLAAVDYAEVVDPETFRPGLPLAVMAVRVGPVRLIDNHRLGKPFRT